ncbi:MBL fold metallo-hydrolase [Micromonospora sp. NPDC050276]|uniref:MBL fold metallo-hydrolase n=1 Tax=Micromonospora sp. NPDC050276 TaxID=3364278 RepID=UPI00379C4727
MVAPQFHHLAGRVWLCPGDPDPEAVQAGVAVVADERGSVIIDAGQSPAHAGDIQAALAAAGLPEPRWLVYTHHHWDHVWGACAWPGVEIVGHETAVSLLRAEAARPSCCWATASTRRRHTCGDPRTASTSTWSGDCSTTPTTGTSPATPSR